MRESTPRPQINVSKIQSGGGVAGTLFAAISPWLCARVRINRVVATFSTSRPSVVASSSEGKMLNSSGVRT